MPSDFGICCALRDPYDADFGSIRFFPNVQQKGSRLEVGGLRVVGS